MIKYDEKYYKYKNKYLSLKTKLNQNGGVIVQNQTDTGAGVILIENYKPQNQMNYIPCIILFKEKNSGKYSDGGGNRDIVHGLLEDLKVTAVRELKEESMNTFRLNPNTLNDNNAVRHGSYVCYFLYVQGPQNANGQHPIFSNYYFHNKKLIDKPSTPHHWKETDSMIRVSIAQFINDGGLLKQGDLDTIDTSGNKVTILGRTKACIRTAYNDNTYKNSLNTLVTLSENKNYNNPNYTYLTGTSVYYT